MELLLPFLMIFHFLRQCTNSVFNTICTFNRQPTFTFLYFFVFFLHFKYILFIFYGIYRNCPISVFSVIPKFNNIIFSHFCIFFWSFFSNYYQLYTFPPDYFFIIWSFYEVDWREYILLDKIIYTLVNHHLNVMWT